ncbi:unnamed protein product [Paramecium pentaurelia]|uniref:Uncharacterized protein n=1 Tax=Paramecium pentaurelia TaxID=43138 RepID=A0A8S1SGJ9_9CILI|nr:unnamed protein product [Paramecium pentaurelia]
MMINNFLKKTFQIFKYKNQMKAKKSSFFRDFFENQGQKIFLYWILRNEDVSQITVRSYSTCKSLIS